MHQHADTIAEYITWLADAPGDHRCTISMDDHPDAPHALRGCHVRFNVVLQPGSFDGTGHDAWINGEIRWLDDDNNVHWSFIHIDTYNRHIEVVDDTGTSVESY